MIAFYPKEWRDESWPLAQVGGEWYWSPTRAGLLRKVALGNGYESMPGHLHRYETRGTGTYRTYVRNAKCCCVGCPRAAQ